VIAAIEDDPDAILFIDEIHTVVGAGATSGGTMDASNMLKPSLASGELRCIGATTYKEFKSSFERDQALARRFQKIEILEPSRSGDPAQILRGLKPAYEEHHGVHATPQGARARAACAHLPDKHLRDRHLPDSRDRRPSTRPARRRPPRRGPAAGAKEGRPADAKGRRRRPDDADPRPRSSSTPAEVEAVIARMARIPPKSVSTSDRDVLQNASRRASPTCSSARTRPSRRSPTRSSARAPASPAKTSRSARSCSPAPPASARPSSPSPRAAHRRPAAPLRHVRVHGEAQRQPPHRRPARLRRLRPGRPAHRRRLQAAPLGRHPRRDREGPPRPVLDPPAGDGPRHAHRHHRPQDRLPQRHPHHDQQRRRHTRSPSAQDGLRRRRRQGQHPNKPSSAPSAPSSATASTASSCSSAAPDIILQVAGKMLGELEVQLADRDVHISSPTPPASGSPARATTSCTAPARWPPHRRGDQGKLVDELLFGALEKGGHVAVDVDDDDKLSFQFSARSDDSQAN
jgi:hypothetical protein